MMAFSIASRYMTRVTNIGLSVCGILFCLQIFRSVGVCRLSFVGILTAHKTLKCQHKRRQLL